MSLMILLQALFASTRGQQDLFAKFRGLDIYVKNVSAISFYKYLFKFG